MFLPTWEQVSFRPSGSSDKLSTVQSKRSSHVTSHSKTPATSTAQYNRHLESSLPSRCKFVSRRTADWKRSSSRLSTDVSASMWLCNQQAYSSLLRTYGDTLLNAALGAVHGRFRGRGQLPMCALMKVFLTHPLGNAQGAQAFYCIKVEVILCFTPDLFLMPSSGVI